MASPFPGMDPYLEGADWLPFHGQFIAELASQLSPKLLPKYAALMGQREVLSIAGPGDEEAESFLYADVAVARTPEGTRIGEFSGRLTATLPAPFTVRSAVGTPEPQRFLEISDTRDRRLVDLQDALTKVYDRIGYSLFAELRGAAESRFGQRGQSLGSGALGGCGYQELRLAVLQRSRDRQEVEESNGASSKVHSSTLRSLTVAVPSMHHAISNPQTQTHCSP